MSVLHLLSWLAGILGFVFVLLSLASGLLYVAEVIEEHSGLAKTVGQRLIYAEILLYLALYFFDGLPLHLVLLGIFAHIVYLGNFSRSWPVISLTSPIFLLSCASVLLSHFLSFKYFSDHSAHASHHSRGGNRYTHYNAYNRGGGTGGKEPTFLDIATFFAVCVWLVPFYLFLSLSANDNVLPSSGETPAPSRRPSGIPSSDPSTSQPRQSQPTSSNFPPSPALSSAPSSPSLSRHTRQRSSMMKSALSSAFSIVPSSLRPSTLSTQLPLLQSHSHQPHGGGVAARNDLPRSPSPSFGFRPYEGQPAFSSAIQTGGLGVSTSSTSPTKPSPLSWSTSSGPPLSPTTTTGLGFSTSSSSSAGANGERGSGGALGSPTLGRTLNFAPNPLRTSTTSTTTTTTFGPPSPAAAKTAFSVPPSPAYATSSFAHHPPPMPVAPAMERRHTTEQQQQQTQPSAPMPGMPVRRASEAPGLGGSLGSSGMGGMAGLLKRRGTDGPSGGGGGRKGV
ncbi:hypothetical protein JCM11251_007834 [Rhodosporidiobolus azoricus]